MLAIITTLFLGGGGGGYLVVFYSGFRGSRVNIHHNNIAVSSVRQPPTLHAQMKIQEGLRVQSEATLVHSHPCTDADARTLSTSTGVAVLFYMDFFF